MSDCVNEFEGVVQPDLRCELGRFVLIHVVEKQGHLQLVDCRGAEPCSVTGFQPN